MLAEPHGGQSRWVNPNVDFFKEQWVQCGYWGTNGTHLGFCLSGGQGWLCPLHPKALGRAAAFAGSWDSPCNAQTAPAASALQQQNPQSSCEGEPDPEIPSSLSSEHSGTGQGQDVDPWVETENAVSFAS